MVYLNRIYTKGGDRGETSLGDGARVPKTHPRIVAYGAVDELNAVIGLAVADGLPDETAAQLRHVQNDLFDVGADLCVPEDDQAASVPDAARRGSPDPAETADRRSPPQSAGADQPAGDAPRDAAENAQRLRVTAAHVERLERWIDAANETLEPLRSFVLPGGTAAAARLHHARTVCRRAEIEVLYLAGAEAVNPQVCIYLNRLSDLLFVLARRCNAGGAGDVLWEPGRLE